MNEQVSQAFKDAIKSHLDKMAQADDAFASKYGNPSKSIDECCDYIISQVKHSGRCGFADDEIFGMAVHYYDEENLGEWKKAGDCKVVVNHSIELSEEEKESARKEAMERVIRDEEKKIKERQDAARKKASEAKAKAKEEAKKENEVSLFDGLFDDATED